MELFVLPLKETWTRQALSDKPVCDPREQRSASGRSADASGILRGENPPGHPSTWDLPGAGSPGLVDKDCCPQSLEGRNLWKRLCCKHRPGDRKGRSQQKQGNPFSGPARHRRESLWSLPIVPHFRPSSWTFYCN